MVIEFFDPEMCCSTGVCGTSPDPELIRVGEMVETLKANGHTVVRHMLSRDSSAFTANTQIYQLMLQQGMQCLPIVTVDGEIRSQQHYPTLDEVLAVKES